MIVVIDPGHGGSEKVGGSSANNATGPQGTLEKDLTLGIGLTTRDKLAAAGHSVLMTRDSDVNLGLSDRARVAKDNDADVLVSIHFNGFDNPSVQGTETWVHDSHTENSKAIADHALARLVAATGYRDRGVRNKVLGVLNPDSHLAKTAACLVEVSFITDPADEQRLQDEAYRDSIAAALAQAVEDYAAQNAEVPLTAAAEGGSENTIA